MSDSEPESDADSSLVEESEDESVDPDDVHIQIILRTEQGHASLCTLRTYDARVRVSSQAQRSCCLP